MEYLKEYFFLKTYHNEYYLLLLLIIPALLAWYLYKRKKINAALQISTIEGFDKKNKTMRQRLQHILFVLRIIIVALLIIALARPQSSKSRKDVTVEGIDIVLTMDISGSMLAEDFKPNRLEAAKEVAMEFIDGRPDDRIGLVVFSGESFTQCPLTTDHIVLKNLFSKIESGMIEDGTAIGDGLATSVNRLKNSKAKSKVIILLTDGVNNRGFIDPITAAEIIKKFGIRVYTIGVGKIGMAPYPFKTPFGIQYENIEVKIDEPLLKNISAMTDGKYFRAINKTKLREIYSEIDKLEKSKIDVTEYHKKQEKYLPLVLLVAFLFLGEIVLRYTYFKQIP
ncbi:MAG: VWA domain-containing protein [Bacteroidales bacterium]|jgi:Ca-activated chloride channel family protein